ncbi:glycerophosphodiester phosphodiesterase family protein [Labedella populi]|nr:glycerophosphodiester phosphodiesterase family protein [Labedella populi]
MDVRVAVRSLAHTPLRVWAVLVGVYATCLIIGRPAVHELLGAAAVAAGVEAVSPGSFPALLTSPVAWLFGSAALLVSVASALVWTALTLAVVARGFDDARTVRAVLTRAAVILRHWTRSGLALLAVPLALLSPLAGFGVLSPLTASLSIPPFIAREFLKAPLSGALWVAMMTATVLASFAVIMLLSWSNDGEPRSVRRARREARESLRRLRGPACAVAVVAVATAVIPPDATIVSGLVSVLASLAIAVAFVTSRYTPPSTAVASHRPAAWSPARATVVIALGAVALTISGSVVAPTASSAGEADGPLVIAHRGYDRGGPENTISGLEAAARRGADVVEVDIQQTADGDFVAAHDTNLLVLAGIDRSVSEMTTSELTRTTVSMHGRSDTIPTMEDYVRRAHDLGVPLLLEFKVTGQETPDFVERALRRLDALGALDGRNTFQSLDVETVRTLERLRPDLSVGVALAMYSGELPRIGADFFVVEQASVTAAMIADAHDRRAPLYAWTVNDDLEIRALLDLGVDGIITDRIDSPVLGGDGARP